jgi:hypothetical protein
VLVSSKPVQSSLMFAGKARSLPKMRESESSTQVGSDLTRNHSTRLESPARVKNPSLLGTFVITALKKFYNIGPWSLGDLMADLI